MRTLTPLALMLALSSSALVAEECSMPDMPTLPDGNSATMEEMIAGQQAVKAFQAAVETFRGCQDTMMETLKTRVAEGDEAAVADFQAATDAYNASVSLEEKLAEQFNQAIRDFKAANPS